MSSPTKKRRGSNPLARLFSSAGNNTSKSPSSRDELGLTKTTLRLVPAASAPPVIGGGPLPPSTSSGATGTGTQNTSSFVVFQAKMLTLEYEEEEEANGELKPGRVAYAPIQLPRGPVPRIKVTEPDDIPFELKPEDILPEWINPPPRVIKRRTWEEELEMVRKVWRSSTGLSFTPGEPEVLDVRRITKEELREYDSYDSDSDADREVDKWLDEARQKEIESVIPVSRITEKELQRHNNMMAAVESARMVGQISRAPETPPESPREKYIAYNADAHMSMSHYSSIDSPMYINNNNGTTQTPDMPAGLLRRGSTTAPPSAAMRHARKNSLTRSPSVRKRSGSTASQGSFREQEGSEGTTRVRRISTDFSTPGGAPAAGETSGQNTPKSPDSNKPLPTPPISPPTPTNNTETTVAAYLRNGHRIAGGGIAQYSPIGPNPYHDDPKSPSIPPPAHYYAYHSHPGTKPYDPEVESLISDVSSLTEASIASLSSFSVSSISAGAPSRSASLSSPTRRGSLIAGRSVSVGWGTITEEEDSSVVGQFQEIGGYPMTGRVGGGGRAGEGYGNGDYYYQQYRLQELDDIAALGIGSGEKHPPHLHHHQQQIPSYTYSHQHPIPTPLTTNNIRNHDIETSTLPAPSAPSPEKTLEQNRPISREITRKALPSIPPLSVSTRPLSSIPKHLQYAISPTSPSSPTTPTTPTSPTSYLSYYSSEDDAEDVDIDAEARLRRMREIVAGSQGQQGQQVSGGAGGMGKGKGNGGNVIKRKPVMNIAAAVAASRLE